mmetsp:Transcript_4806/g.18196  ORF Transcript_4806/g.18196 Transcript_4806/m.18196 type:complete len:121 (+) Transcript_4806:401-763(+)
MASCTPRRPPLLGRESRPEPEQIEEALGGLDPDLPLLIARPDIPPAGVAWAVVAGVVAAVVATLAHLEPQGVGVRSCRLCSGEGSNIRRQLLPGLNGRATFTGNWAAMSEAPGCGCNTLM